MTLAASPQGDSLSPQGESAGQQGIAPVVLARAGLFADAERMSIGDPRHGMLSGHAAGCRKDCCNRAKLRYDKKRKLDTREGRPRTVPVVGTVRRIRALQALGYSLRSIAETAGLHESTIANPILRGTTTYATTAAAVARAYDALSMQQPPAGGYAERNRRRARRLGWAPPLAWDDDQIDDPDASPTGVVHTRDERRGSGHVDESRVERILAGEQLETTAAERRAVIARWIAQGRSERVMCLRMGWRPGRYTRAEEAS